ncbi:hypothetical protein E0F15_17835 [Frankia sp. B2]|uniref:hypothetical protein n=1 Tax=unclassified Frankia TaxID=2632575 RepID=UPI0006CA1CA1|nr:MULTISPECIES: hypothetical protein [unclassified Frankia]KPM52715.1 hypothetical protein ACG83_24850 [Frankia sp. R43]TFE26499.1 hypothetical protein E0F15_17835 [Frankia sp. B2]
MSRIIAPRFELELWPGADGLYIAVDLLKPSLRLLLPIEGPYSAEYADLRLRTLVPREVAETLLTLAGAAMTTGRAAPIHHLTRRPT